MKKLSTLIAAMCVGATAFAAVPTNYDVYTDLKVQYTPETQQMFRTKTAELNARMLSGNVEAGENFSTRQWVDKAGNIWELSILVDGEKICDMLTFADDQGQTVKVDFNKLPYYHALFRLTSRSPQELTRSTQVFMHLCWPARYMFDQIFEYDGELEADKSIPIDKRDYSITPIDMLCNSTEYCKLFQESDGVGFESEDGGKTIAYYTMLCTEKLGISQLYGGEYAFTELTDSKASKIEFRGYELQDGVPFIEENNRIYLKIAEHGKQYTIRNTYAGTSRVEGFTPSEVTYPEFGDVHLFNAGLHSTEALGDACQYTRPFTDLTAFYITVGDKYLNWYVDEAATHFDESMILNGGLELPEGEDLDSHASYLQGYIYADAKYAKDINLDPKAEVFAVNHVDLEYSDIAKDYITLYAPEANCIVPFGYDAKWSELYGLLSMFQQDVDKLAEGARIGWGTKNGFILEGDNIYFKRINASSVGNLIYHYDPTDMQKTRIFSLVGDKEWEESGVEDVATDAAAKVSASNGVITVVPAEAGEVAVYSLDGACVKSVKAYAGATVTVNAAKGVYVVVVNGKSSKVML